MVLTKTQIYKIYHKQKRELPTHSAYPYLVSLKFRTHKYKDEKHY